MPIVRFIVNQDTTLARHSHPGGMTRVMDALLARNAARRERRRNPNAQTESVFRSARNRFHRIVRTAKQSFGRLGKKN